MHYNKYLHNYCMYCSIAIAVLYICPYKLMHSPCTCVHTYMCIRTYVCIHIHLQVCILRMYCMYVCSACELSSVWCTYMQSDLTYPHTSILDEISDNARELDK